MNEPLFTQQLQEGIRSLENIPKSHLIQMYRETTTTELKDKLGCEILYKEDSK